MTDAEAPKMLKLGPTTCYFVQCPGGYLQIDTSFPVMFDRYLEGLKTLNIDVSEIKYLLLTHYHDDHSGFAAALKEKSGCQLIVAEKSLEPLRNGTLIKINRYLNRRVQLTLTLYSKLKRRTFSFEPIIPDDRDLIVRREGREVLGQIGIDGKILFTPGHTPDSISLVLADGSAFVGDVSSNFLNFCSTHYRPILLYSPDQVYESWRKIVDEGARSIYPAHGKPFRVDRLIRFGKKFAPKKIDPASKTTA
ncbi:MAG TPA: MBL fold metallo-hydrolase [Methanocella sp.]|nr:MBL fold metallo-hydrolase [Methanocella sp.]